MVDDQEFNWAFLRYEIQTELGPHGFEDCGQVLNLRRNSFSRRIGRKLRTERHSEVVGSGEVSLVYHRALVVLQVLP